MNIAVRAAALAEYAILDTPAEQKFDDFTRLASQICGTPVSLISLLDSGRQWFKSKLGVEVSQTPIEQSFCTHAVENGKLLEVPDALDDPRFRANPLVTGEPKIRFYAGTPLITPEGIGIGSLCVIDTKPRNLSIEQRNALEALGRQLMHLFELRRAARRLQESQAEIRGLNQNLERLVSERTCELRDSEERFRQLAENSSDVFWFVDLHPERILYVSPAVREIWGLPPEHFYKNPRAWLNSVHPEDRARVLEETEGAIRSIKAHFEIEYRVVRPDGIMRWVLYRGTPIRNAAGEIERVAGIAKDITERKEAAAALQLSMERLQLATKASRVGIWDLDLASGRADWDEEMFRLFGLGKENVVPGIERWIRSVHPEDREMAMSQLNESFGNPEKAFDTEFRIIRESDGITRNLRATGTIFRDKEGKALRMIGTNWDVTEDRQRERDLALALSQQKELTRSAQAGERAKSEFLAVMSHEIRTPLNGILGFADILAETREIPEESRSHIETIASSGQSLLRILNDVLDFSRIEAGQLGIERTAYSPAELVSEIGSFFHHQARIQGLELRTDIDASIPPTVAGDPGRIRQILLNLTGNALKFTDTGSVEVGVHLRFLPDGAQALDFFVEDSGAGIPAEKLGSIFDAFTQADSSSARHYGGTGLGLTISRKLAHLMGGSLTVENRPKKGARFSFCIPVEVIEEGMKLSNTSLKESVNLRLAPPELGKVVVVEDDNVNLRLILNLMRKLGFEPLTARTGLEAVALYEQEHPACILMDVQMPEMDGIEATRRIREIENARRDPPAFIIAFTANVLPADRRHCFEAGMNFYLNKPIKRQALAEALEAAAEFLAKGG